MINFSRIRPSIISRLNLFLLEVLSVTLKKKKYPFRTKALVVVAKASPYEKMSGLS